MPNTDRHPPAAEVVAERYGLPTVDAARTHLIATLHALIAWIIDHPGLPVPGMVQLRHHPAVDGGTLTKVDLIDLANALGGSLESSPTGHSWARVPLLPRGSGPGVEYVLHEGGPRT